MATPATVDPSKQAAFEELSRRGLINTPEKRAAVDELIRRGLLRQPAQAATAAASTPPAAPPPESAPPPAAARKPRAAPGAAPAAAGARAPTIAAKGTKLPTLGEIGQGAVDLLTVPGDAFNAFHGAYVQAIQDGAAPGEAINRAIQAAQVQIDNPAATAPPRYTRDLLRMEKGKTDRRLYNVASVADYVLDFVANPGAKIGGRVVEKGTSLLRRGAAPIAATVAGRAAQSRPVRTAGRAVSWAEQKAEEMLQNKAVQYWGKAVGLQKAALLSNPGTTVTNAGANALAMELAAQKHGIKGPALLRGGKQAVQEVFQFRKDGAVSQDIADLGARVKDFGSQFAKGAKPSKNPFLRAQQENDIWSKLSLYKSLRAAGRDPDEAAAIVKRSLLTYDDRSSLLELADKGGVWMFNHVPVHTGKLLIETAVTRPDLLARYPRVKKQLEEEMGRPDPENLSPWIRSSPFIFPAGDGKVIDVGRYHPLSASIEMAQGIARKARQGAFSEEEGAGDVPFAGTILGPSLRAHEKTKKEFAGSPPGGRLPSDKQLARVAEEVKARVPLARLADRTAQAARGLGTSSYKFSEPQQRGQVALSALGVNLYTAETEEAKRKRVAPDIVRRGKAGEAFIGRVAADLKSGRLVNPYTEPLAEERNLLNIARRAQGARTYLQKQILSPANINARGEIAAEARPKITRAFLNLMALDARAKELHRVQRAPR